MVGNRRSYCLGWWPTLARAFIFFPIMGITTKVNVLLCVVFWLFVRMGFSLGGSLETDSRPSNYKEQMLQRLKEQNKSIIQKQAKESKLKDKLDKLGIHAEFEDVLLAVGTRWAKQVYGKPIKPEYLIAIWLSENMRNYWAVGDSWCSRGAYQMNWCAGKWRWDQVHHGMKFKECSLDPYCSTKRTVDRIFTTYKCNVQDDGTISNWKQCLSKHQGQVPDGWYVQKIAKNWEIVGLLSK